MTAIKYLACRAFSPWSVSAIPDDELDAVKAMVQSGLPVLPWEYLAVGQRVRIRYGKLAGLEGILARDKAVDRVVIKVEMLGRAVAVEIDRESLAPAGVAAPHSPRELLIA